VERTAYPQFRAVISGRELDEVWAALFFPDSCLIAISCCGPPIQVLVVGLLWGLVSECRVETLSIVAEFDIPGNILSGVFTGGVDGTVDPFDFHGGIEGFGESVGVS
jgi:hypothetical protein